MASTRSGGAPTACADSARTSRSISAFQACVTARPWRHLGQLADHRSNVDAAHLLLDRGHERGLDEVAHLHEAGFLEFGQLAHGEFLAAPAGGENDAELPLPGRHVDPLDDAGAKSGSRVGTDDAGSAENGNAADDSEARVQRLFGHFLTAGHRNGHQQAVVREQFAARSAHVVADIALRYRVDRRPADKQAEALAGHRTDSGAPLQFDLAGPLRQQAHSGGQMRAVRGIGIIAGILDDCRMRRTLRAFTLESAVEDGKADLLPIRQAAEYAAPAPRRRAGPASPRAPPPPSRRRW
jgi:hypothetical protein